MPRWLIDLGGAERDVQTVGGLAPVRGATFVRRAEQATLYAPALDTLDEHATARVQAEALMAALNWLAAASHDDHRLVAVARH